MNSLVGIFLRILQDLVALAHVLDKAFACNTLEFGDAVGEAWSCLSRDPCHRRYNATQASCLLSSAFVCAASFLADVDRTDLLCVVLRRDGDAHVFVLHHFFAAESEGSFISFAD